MSAAPDQTAAPNALIASAAEAHALAERLGRATVLALDTEGDGMFRYRARLCTLQFASDAELAVVDMLAVAPHVFSALLGAGGPEKVVHDMAFDARLLSAHGIALGSVFDTAIAARFLGFPATGLASLLALLFDVQLEKHLQQADWGLRPLDEDAVHYLENDVRYLLALHAELLARVRAQAIEDEVREECAYVLGEAQKSAQEPSPFLRVKGALGRPPRERARIYELALVRDALARELDEPPSRLLASELLLRLSELEQLGLDDLERRLSTRSRPYAPALLAAHQRGRERSDAPAEELSLVLTPPPPPSELAKRKRRRELLTGFRAQEAAARGVDLQVVLPGHCVNDMVKLPRLDLESLARVDGLGACRRERYATRWERELGPSWG